MPPCLSGQAAKLYGKHRSNWDLRISHWKRFHPKEPREKFLAVMGRPKGTSMQRASFAKRLALVAQNVQILKRDCNGHRPTEIVWPFSTEQEGVTKKFVCTAYLSKLVKTKCRQKATGRRTRYKTIEWLQSMIGAENSVTKKKDLSWSSYESILVDIYIYIYISIDNMCISFPSDIR